MTASQGGPAQGGDPSLIIWEDKRPAPLALDEDDEASRDEEGGEEDDSVGADSDSPEGAEQDLQVELGTGEHALGSLWTLQYLSMAISVEVRSGLW